MKAANSSGSIVACFKPPKHGYRSVNLKMDLDTPALIATYLPTQKSIEVLEGVLDSFEVGSRDRASSIIAPYGSGKSSLLLFLCALLEKRPSCRQALIEVRKRIAAISPVAAKKIKQFAEARKKHLAVALSGENVSLEEAFVAGLEEALRRCSLRKIWTRLSTRTTKPSGRRQTTSAIDLYRRAAELLASQGFGGIVVVFDEFGKVLEAQQTNSRPEDLIFLQTFAELCSRSGTTQLHLLISLHQGFAQYAHRLPTYTRNEWAKIEGRFRTFHFVEDSVQVYELIAQAIGRLRCADSEEVALGMKRHVRAFSAAAIKIPAFSPFESIDQLTQVLQRVYPLDPLALYILPRLSARVAQNERTLFHFLLAQDPGCLYPTLARRSTREAPFIRLSDLFAYFSDLMMKDTGVGGVYRRYIEISTAMERAAAADSLSQDLIKAIGIVSIINEPGKLPTTGSVLELAVGAFTDEERQNVKRTLRDLVSKKILLHRRHSDEYRIWEGADVDLIGILRHKKVECEGRFDPVAFLATKISPPAILAHRYNEDFGIVRHFEGQFCSSEGLRRFASWDKAFQCPQEADGKVYYVLAETTSEIVEAVRIAKQAEGNHQALFAIPRGLLNLFDPLLELYCLDELLADSNFVSQDPVLQRELAELADDCLTAIQRKLVRFLEPRNQEALWIYRGTQRDAIKGHADLKRLVSDACRDVFPLTPRFHNELINRRHPSTTIVNARKKLVRAMLQDLKSPNLGLIGYGPEVSIFRALLLRTGIYRTDLGTFARSDQVGEPCVARVLRTIEDFFYSADRYPRAFAPLIDELLSPPLGLRAGVVPVLLAAAVQAFPLPLNILEDGVFVKELKAETFERILLSPEKVTIQSIRLSEQVNSYIAALPSIFGGKVSERLEVDTQRRLLQNALESIYHWLHALPSCAMTTQRLTKPTLVLREILVRATDPAALVLHEIPRIYLSADSVPREGSQIESEDYQVVLSGLRANLSELESHKSRLIEQAQIILRSAFSQHDWSQTGSAIANLRSWVLSLTTDIKDYLQDPQCSGLISRIMSNYEDDAALLESLCSLVTGRSISYWDDNFLRQFELGVLQIYRKICETDALLKTRDRSDPVFKVLTILSSAQMAESAKVTLGNVSAELSETLLAAKFELEQLMSKKLQKLSREDRARVLVELLKGEL